jgi:MoxR-like ATPase
MLKCIVNYPRKEEEKLIVRMNNGGQFPEPNAVVSPEDIIRARKIVREVYMDEKIERYIVDIVFATRTPAEYGLKELESLIAFGGSPRASISLSLAAKAYAFIKRRGYVIPEDVRAVCYEVLRHRIGLTYEADAENVRHMIATTQNFTGFHAMEYVIFRNGQPRNYSDLTADEKFFVLAVAEDLYLSACRLEVAWASVDAEPSRITLLEEAEMNLANRVISLPEDELTSEAISTINASDIPEFKLEKRAEFRIGFAS